MFKNSVHVNGNIKTLNASPDTLRTGHAIPSAPQMAADTPDHAYRLRHGRRFCRGLRGLQVIAAQRLPFDLFKKYRTGVIRDLTTEHRQVINAPGNNHVDTQTGPVSYTHLTLPTKA